MVKKLLGPKREGLHPDYERENFERVLAEAFDVERRERLEVGHAAAVLRPPQGRPSTSPRPRAARGGARGRAPAAGLAAARLRPPRGAVRLRARPAAVQPALRQPGVLRRARVHGERDHRVRAAAGAGAAGDPAGDRAAGGPGERRAPATCCTWSSSAGWRPWCSCRRSRRRIDAGDTVLIVLALGARAPSPRCSTRAPSRCARSSACSRPAPLVFLVLFLFISTVSKITLPEDASAKSADGVERVPVVMIVFDEFPSTSLLDADGQDRRQALPGASRGWPRTPPGSATPTRSTTPPAARCRRSWTATCRRRSSAAHRRRSTPTASSRCSARATRMNVSEEATSVCPARPVRGRPPGRAVRRPARAR